jgi:flagellar biogenesis protein FliO
MVSILLGLALATAPEAVLDATALDATALDATALDVAPLAVQAEETPAAKAPAPASPSAADTVVAAAFLQNIGTPPDSLKPTGFESVGASTALIPLLALAGLGTCAALLARRRQVSARGIHIVESAGLGPKRSLVVADVLGERLVLAVSEAGISVLSTRPAPAPALAEAFEAEPERFPPRATRAGRRPIAQPRPMTFFQRLLGRAPMGESFESQLGTSLEDEELRAKLAAGLRGVVP